MFTAGIESYVARVNARATHSTHIYRYRPSIEMTEQSLLIGDYV